MSDGIKTMVGATGTTVSVILGSVTLHDWSAISAIAAGFATAVWMGFQIANRVRDLMRERNKKQ